MDPIPPDGDSQRQELEKRLGGRKPAPVEVAGEKDESRWQDAGKDIREAYRDTGIGVHLEELRERVFVSLYALFGVLCICLIDQEFYMELVLAPHKRAMAALNLSPTIQVLHYQESFFAHLKVSAIAALIISMPYLMYQAWLFVSCRGLKKSERRYVRLFFPLTIIFFMAGVLFGYFVLIPMALRFLGGYGGSNIEVGFTLSAYISLFFVLTFVAGLVFELPIAMLFLSKAGIYSSQKYLSGWRHFILFAFVIAALLTPPDAVTQILLATPMTILYFLGVLLCRLSERKEALQRLFAGTSHGDVKEN